MDVPHSIIHLKQGTENIMSADWSLCVCMFLCPDVNRKLSMLFWYLLTLPTVQGGQKWIYS